MCKKALNYVEFWIGFRNLPSFGRLMKAFSHKCHPPQLPFSWHFIPCRLKIEWKHNLSRIVSNNILRWKYYFRIDIVLKRSEVQTLFRLTREQWTRGSCVRTWWLCELDYSSHCLAGTPALAVTASLTSGYNISWTLKHQTRHSMGIVSANETKEFLAHNLGGQWTL